MKNKIIFQIFVLIIFLILGILFIIYMPDINKIEKEIKTPISSNITDVTESNISNLVDTKNDKPHQKELYDSKQMYFKNIDLLYDFFTFKQVEYIKERIQYYIKNPDILDCSIENFKIEGNKAEFMVLYGESDVLVEVTKITKKNTVKVVFITNVTKI